MQLNQRTQPHGSPTISVATLALENSMGAAARTAGF